MSDEPTGEIKQDKCRFRVGDRVIVAHSDWWELNCYYGHVSDVLKDRKPSFPMVDVVFHGRAAKPVDRDFIGTPWPMFPHELEHAD